MKIIEQIASLNPCYQADRKITPSGVMVHSIGVAQPDPEVIVNNFNRTSADTCVHAVVGAGEDVYQILPWDTRAWHAGSGKNGSANDTHISFEMTEPSSIRYTQGAQWTDLDPEATKAFVKKTYRNGVELTAKLCVLYGLNPAADGVVISHSEGNKRGIASNHADVEHIWSRLGLSMDQFRKDVALKMAETDTDEEKKDEEEAASGTAYIVQAGSFASEANARAHASALNAAGFDAFVRKIS